MSLKEGLSTLLEIVKDGDNDSLALKNEPNVDEIDGSMEEDGSSMEAKGSLGVKSQSRALSNHTGKSLITQLIIQSKSTAFWYEMILDKSKNFNSRIEW